MATNRIARRAGFVPSSLDSRNLLLTLTHSVSFETEANPFLPGRHRYLTVSLYSKPGTPPKVCACRTPRRIA